MNKLISLVCCLVFTACSSWPKEGQGGIAEIRPPHVDGIEHYSLVERMNALNNKIYSLKVSGAQECIPGRIKALERDAQLITREIHGGLTQDASYNMYLADIEADYLICYLASVQVETGCYKDQTIIGQAEWFKLDLSSRCNRSITAKNQNIDYINEVLFDSASIALKPYYLPYLDNLAEIMTRQQDMQVRITGHTDNVGEDFENDNLGLKRSSAIAEYLQQKGIPKSRIITRSKGESSPRENNNNALGKQFNRRAYIELIKLELTDTRLIKDS